MGPEGFLLHSSELLQGDERKYFAQETGSPRGLYLPEEKFPETTRDQRDPELPQPQALPLYGILWRKSKSLELRRPPCIGSQGLRGLQAPSPQPQGSPSIDAMPPVPQGHKPTEDGTFQSHQPEETGPTRHKSLQAQGIEQQEGRSRGLQNGEEAHGLI
ncbi:hypothetical protein JRQ81_015478 [Phrynocephalus forsythii]|uniref:Uncharacterized protein n=1 Tax=Phrynocephalus forsythii TaxID=171643 RepID=A0A9Q0XV23_9SAUR|nr:hypothetical protein JRQ81_015478 [Phrynocephalus forsythii]